ncbi:hypothetical protein KI387_030023, partial [Taxus chinensis]
YFHATFLLSWNRSTPPYSQIKICGGAKADAHSANIRTNDFYCHIRSYEDLQSHTITVSPDLILEVKNAMLIRGLTGEIMA